MRELLGWFDGATEPKNPGGHSVCAWIWKERGAIIAQQAIDRGTRPGNTNNDAEYRAALGALKWLADSGINGPCVAVMHGDSKLVVEQVGGAWNCNTDHLRLLRDAARRGISILESKGISVALRWIPRDQNAEADALSKSLYSASELKEIERVEAWRRSKR